MFKLNLPSSGDDPLPGRDVEEGSPELQAWAEMCLAFDHLRARLAALRDSDPEEVVRIRRDVTRFLHDTADGIDA